MMIQHHTPSRVYVGMDMFGVNVTFPEEGDELRKSIEKAKTIKELAIKRKDLGVFTGKPMEPPFGMKIGRRLERREKKESQQGVGVVVKLL